ncbi:MAG TPA: TRAP transporter substrate-binding protein [Candidatus Competibacteraceae bacterium]|nr:TRAP transporter substrate-binding protein [Candidatus Competibacteraceae bacterium]
MFKKALAFTAGLVLCTSAGFPALAAEVTLKLGHAGNEQHSWHKAALRFGELVAAKTNGAVEVKVFPSEQLGKELDVINAIQLGSVDLTVTGESLQNWAPKAALLAVPYMIRDERHLTAVVNGPIGQEIAKEVEDKTQLKAIAWFARGPRNLTANRPIKSPAELNGLVMRVPNVPLFLNVWKALGAKPTPMAFSEVFTALQQGVVEAQENPLSLIKSASFFEVQKYVNQTEHVRSWIYLVMGVKKFNKLKPEYQQAILDAAKEAQAYEHELFLKDEQQLIDDLKAKGMQFVEVDQQAFAEGARKAVEESLKPELKPLYQQILAIQ